MGDPKKLKKKYSTPRHPWNRTAIEEEKVLVREYGLAKKQEIYRANSFLKKYKDIAKRLIADTTIQGSKERRAMIEKLAHLGLLPPGARLDDVLSLKLKDILERRIQSRIVRRGLARSMNQARQAITHRHITLGEKEITSPSYLVSLDEEAVLSFKERSPFHDPEHPERVAAAAGVTGKEAHADIPDVPLEEQKMQGSEHPAAEAATEGKEAHR